jgi:hypothetical protein
MSVLAPISQRFAVISVHSEPRRERVIIAYRDEKSLHDFLAGASILALGFHSREEAEANIEPCTPTAHAFRPNLIATLVNKTARSLKEFVASHSLSRGGYDAGRTPTTFWDILQQSVVAAVVLIYSENFFSATVRALVSF